MPQRKAGCRPQPAARAELYPPQARPAARRPVGATSARATTQVLKLSHDQVVNALTAFRAMDRTGDGSIDCDEFAQVRPAPLLPENWP